MSKRRGGQGRQRQYRKGERRPQKKTVCTRCGGATSQPSVVTRVRTMYDGTQFEEKECQRCGWTTQGKRDVPRQRAMGKAPGHFVSGVYGGAEREGPVDHHGRPVHSHGQGEPRK